MSNEYSQQDKDLLLMMRNGDNSCFELLYRRYKGKVYNFILSVSNGDFYLAEEIVQNVFIKIWQDRKKIKLEGSFASLLFTMAKNMFLNELRDRVQQTLYQEHLQKNYNEYDNVVDKDIEYKLLEAEIDRLIAQLPPMRRKVYQLSKRNNMSNKEIAEQLNISEKTVESHLFLATGYMRKVLAVRLNIPMVCMLLSLNLV